MLRILGTRKGRCCWQDLAVHVTGSRPSIAPSELGPSAVVDGAVRGTASLAPTEGSFGGWSSRSEVAEDVRWTMVRNSHIRLCGWPLTLFFLLLITLLIIVLLRGAEAAIQYSG